MNHPFVCKLNGLAGPLPFAPPAPLLPGITNGCACRCNGGGLTLDTLFRFVRVLRAGPPLVLGGFAGSVAAADARERERDRLLLNSAPAPPVADTGDGVWRIPLLPLWYDSDVVVMLEKFESDEIPEMCELKLDTDEGSPPAPFVGPCEDPGGSYRMLEPIAGTVELKCEWEANSCRGCELWFCMDPA